MEVERLGATLVADYGSFQVYSSYRSDATPFGKLDGVEIAHDFNIVHLNVPIDTTSRGAQELSRQRLRGGGKHLHVVQFAGPTRREWLDELLRAGVELVNYLPHNAYLVYGDAASIERVTRLGEGQRTPADTVGGSGFKQWDGPYLGAFKLDPATANAPTRGKARYAVQLVADPSQNDATISLAESLAGSKAVQRYQIANFVNFIVELPTDALTTLAAQEDVISVMPYVEPTLLD
ncbi:MAG: hypothetical protein CFK52_11560, partial [Chloracidobacterium sp. CP2_5A]